MLDRHVDELGQFGKLDDVVELPDDIPFLHSEDGSVEEDVLPSGEIGMKPGAQREERGGPSHRRHLALGGGDGSCDDSKKGALTRSVTADDPQRLPLPDRERDVPEGPELLTRGALAQKTEGGRFESRLPVMAQVVHLAQALDSNHRFFTHDFT